MTPARTPGTLLSSWKIKESHISCRVVRAGTFGFTFRGQVAALGIGQVSFVDIGQNKLDLTFQSSTNVSFPQDETVSFTLTDGTEVSLRETL